MKRKLILIDGNFLILRCFFGAMNSYMNGNPRHYAWELILNKIFQMKVKWPDSDIYLVLEGQRSKIDKYRYYPEYKANRKHTLPHSFVKELRYTNYFCIISGIPLLRSSAHEADDLIASIAHQYQSSRDVIIFTQDKDFYQIVSKDISLVDFNLNTIHEETILKKLELRSISQISSYFSLVGDVADNLKGVLGIGPKTGSKLINRYGNICNLVKCNEKNDKLKRLINDNLRGLLMNFYMITLNRHIKLSTLPRSIPFKRREWIRCLLQKNHRYHLLDKLNIWWNRVSNERYIQE